MNAESRPLSTRRLGAVAAAPSLDRPLQWLLTAVAAVLILAPLVPILWQSVLDKPLYEADRALTLGNYGRVLGSAELWSTLATTLLFAVLTTAVSVVVGTALAVVLGRTDVPSGRVLHNLVLAPFYVSPLVLAFAWAIVYGPAGFVTLFVKTSLGLPTWELYSLGGIAIVAAVYYLPYAYLYAAASLALTDPQLEDAARLAGAGPLRTLLAVTVPLLRPAFASGLLLTFVSAVELLSIPLVLGSPVGVQVLATWLYQVGIGSQTDYAAVAVVSVLMLVTISGLVWLQVRMTGLERRFVTVGGKATRGRVLRLGGLRWPVALALWLYALLAVLVPLTGILAQSATSFLTPLVNPLELLTWDHYAMVLLDPAYRRSITNSLEIAAVGGAVGIAFIALLALIVYRSDFPLRGPLGYLVLYPRAVPGVIVGIGFLWAFLLVPGIGPARNTLAALTVAFIVRFIPLGFGAVGPSILRVSGELDRAARVSGATWTGTVLRVLLPLLRPALLAGFVLLFISFLKEYSSALFLVTHDSEVIGTTMIGLWRQGNSGPVAALSTAQLTITFVVLLAANKLLGARING